MDSRGKSKLALTIFLSLSPLPLIFYLLNCSWVHLSNDFFWLTVYYVFISLEMAAAGSLINGSKSCFCQSQTNKNLSVSISLFVSAFLKQALFPSPKSDAPVAPSSNKGIFLSSDAQGRSFSLGQEQDSACRSGEQEQRKRERDVVLGRLRKS